MEPDERADHLAGIACDLVTRVRDQDPASVHRWLTSVVDPADWMALCVVLACAVPDDQPWKALTAWTWVRDLPPSRSLQPCGTIAALHRHWSRRERPCDPCRAVDRERKRDERARKVPKEQTVG